MSALVPLKHADLHRGLRAFGWEGPFKKRGKECYMTKGARRLSVPNKHGNTINDVGLVRDILRRFEIDEAEFLKSL